MVNQLFYGGNYWKKLPKFNSLEQIEELKINMKYYHKHTTTNYWATDNSQHQCRKLISQDAWRLRPEEQVQISFCRDLQLQLIPISQSLHKLRFGYKSSGSFSIKEAYNLEARFLELPKEDIWYYIWILEKKYLNENILLLMASCQSKKS